MQCAVNFSRKLGEFAVRCIFYFNPHPFRVEPDAVAIDESREGTIGGKRSRGADGETVLLHQPETVGELQRQLYIVGGEQDCLVLLVCQAAEHLKGFYLAGEIEEGGRLVEDDDAGLLGKRLGYHRLLALAIAQLGDAALGEVGDADLVDGFIYYLLICRSQGAPEIGVGRPADAYNLLDRQLGNIDAGGENHADLTGKLLCRISGKGLVLKADFALQGWLETAKGSEQGGFAHSVGTDEAGEFARLQRGRNSRGYHPELMLRMIANA